jgi:hypothetical protein
VDTVVLAMKQAIGLGPGFTPSGDDFLTGFIGASRCFSAGAFTDEVGAYLRRLIHRTTLPSFFMLKAALDGCFCEALSDLLASLAGRSVPAVRKALGRLADIGATSGKDMIAGVMAHLDVRMSCRVDHAACIN